MSRILLVFLCLGCQGGGERPGLDTDLEALRAEYGLAALNVGLLRDGRLIHTGSYGDAQPDTLFALASVSKIFVGLAAAVALQEGALDLDTDVNVYLGWAEPLRHPGFPDQAVTLRHLMHHMGGIVADGPDDYETYPKPDPTLPLDGFLEDLLSDETYWLPTAPGEAEEYSNLGVALAALVIEKAVGEPFEVFCEDRLFTPLGMDDTRWFFRELSAAQQARVARPLEEDGTPYEHYGFNDWPSGQLRSTVADLARALEMLMAGGGDVLESVDVFEGTPLLIDADATADPATYSHSGGEAGVNTYVEYDADGNGLIILINQDVAEEEEDALLDAVAERLRAE